MLSKRERAALLSGRTLTSKVTCHTEAAERILPAAPDRQQHTHEFAFFTYVISGSVHETVRGSEQIATQYECRFLPAGEPHANRFLDSAHLLQLSIHGDYIREIEEHSPISMHLGPLPLTFGAFAIRLHRELHIADSSSPLDIESLATTLLCRDQGLHKGDTPPKWLTTAKELLCDCVTKNFSLRDIALAVGVHPVHLCREFSRHYGCTMGRFQRSRRISVASALMRDTEYSLTEIAYASGFTDQSHFNRSFREMTGLRPLSYRSAFSSPADRGTLRPVAGC